jgi:hypothetical protein
MSQQQPSQLLLDNARIELAKQAIRKSQFKSQRAAAKVFKVSRTTLGYQLRGKQPRRDCEANSKKLSNLEEDIISEHILDRVLRGYLPSLIEVADMANSILAGRGGNPVGKKWPSNYVNRRIELKTRFNRKYDVQRAKNEDPVVIETWFRLVRTIKDKYAIQDDDTYNFDKTGFQMGMISGPYVVTGSERRNAPKSVQPGNREWVTVTQGVNALGWAIPPFIIFAGQYHLQAWYEGDDIPSDWPISLSDNGWTTDAITFE